MEQVVDCHRTGNKPLPEPMMTQAYNATSPYGVDHKGAADL